MNETFEFRLAGWKQTIKFIGIWILLYGGSILVFPLLFPEDDIDGFYKALNWLWLAFAIFWLVYKFRIAKRSVGIAPVIITLILATVFGALFLVMGSDDQENQLRVLGPALLSIYLAVFYNPKPQEEKSKTPVKEIQKQ